MPDEPITVQAVGECMVEIVMNDERPRFGYSGDTYNTAVYLRRTATQLGVPVEVRYLSGVGDDAESDLMRDRWRCEGLGDDAVVVRGAAPGMYLIRTDDAGERSFSYCRSNSAAALLFARTDWIEFVRGSVVYLSGITVQLLGDQARSALVDRLGRLRRSGTRVVFDSNYRPSQWRDPASALRAIDDVLRVTDVALVTREDERLRTGTSGIESCVARTATLGVAEVVVKDGPNGAWVFDGDGLAHEPTRPVHAVDTTAAGDSFNGAYLAARLAGAEPREAARRGHRLAAQVVQHPGAILEPEQMPLHAEARGPASEERYSRLG